MTPTSKLAHLVSSNLRAWGRGRESDGATDISDPGGRVELAEELAELVTSGADDGGVRTGLGGVQDGDTVGGDQVEANSSGPAEDNDAVGGDGVDGQDVEADGRLSTLAGDVGLWAGEGGAAGGRTDQEVDAVRVVDEGGREEVGGDVDIKGRQGRDEVVDNLDCCVVWDALAFSAACGGHADDAEGSEDAGETHGCCWYWWIWWVGLRLDLKKARLFLLIRWTVKIDCGLYCLQTTKGCNESSDCVD